MHTIGCQNYIVAGSLPIDSVDFRYTRRSDQDPSTVIRLCNQWIVEDHTDWPAGPQRPPMTISGSG